MRVAEKTGKTVEEAITAGVLDLAVDRDHVKVEVLENLLRKVYSVFLDTRLAKSSSFL